MTEGNLAQDPVLQIAGIAVGVVSDCVGNKRGQGGVTPRRRRRRARRTGRPVRRKACQWSQLEPEDVK